MSKKQYVTNIWVLPFVRKRLVGEAVAQQETVSLLCNAILSGWLRDPNREPPAGPPLTEKRLAVGFRMDWETKTALEQAATSHTLRLSALCARVLGQWVLDKDARVA